MEGNKTALYVGLGILGLVVIGFMMLPVSITRPILYGVLLLGSIFIILLVLIQRGKGGGLAGALGGMGGYSAFGTRAGDLFTKITIVAAALWILAAMALAKINLAGGQKYVNPVALPAASKLPLGLESAPSGTPARDQEDGQTEKSALRPATEQPAGDKRFLDDFKPSEKKDESGSDSKLN